MLLTCLNIFELFLATRNPALPWQCCPVSVLSFQVQKIEFELEIENHRCPVHQVPPHCSRSRIAERLFSSRLARITHFFFLLVSTFSRAISTYFRPAPEAKPSLHVALHHDHLCKACRCSSSKNVAESRSGKSTTSWMPYDSSTAPWMPYNSSPSRLMCTN